MGHVLFKGPVSILLSYTPARSFILTDSGFLLAAPSAMLCTCAVGVSDLVSGALQPLPVCPAQLLSLLPSRDASGCAELGGRLCLPHQL